MRNYPEWLLTYWACVSQGISVVGMNAWWIAREMEFGLQDSTPKVLVCDQERLDRFNEIKASFEDLTVIGVRTTINDEAVIPFADLTSNTGEMPAATFDPDDDACIFYTSGTTGQPKGGSR